MNIVLNYIFEEGFVLFQARIIFNSAFLVKHVNEFSMLGEQSLFFFVLINNKKEFKLI